MSVHFSYWLLVQEGETCPGAGAAGGRCHRGSSAPTGCYPTLPDVDEASSIQAHGVSRALPDAIAPSLASTPDFARRASWPHAIEVKRIFIKYRYREVFFFTSPQRTFSGVYKTIILVGTKVSFLQILGCAF
jgi:hypothetical protein